MSFFHDLASRSTGGSRTVSGRAIETASAAFQNGCPVPKGFESYNVHGTRHKILFYISAGCAAATFLCSVGLILTHLTRYRIPKEQRQIVRLVFAPLIFAIVAVGEVADYNIAAYIDPIGEVYEVLGLCALFLLYVQFAAPSSTFGEDMFQAVSDLAGDNPSNDGNWPKFCWIAVFQVPLVEIVSVIVQEATLATGTYCITSLRPRYGHLWTKIISTLGLGLCIVGILRFYSNTKKLMKAHRGLSKLVMFKIIVFLRLIQTWIFNILMNRGALKPSKSMSFGDLTYGIENALLAAEMALLSMAFWYAYTPSEYSKNAHPRVEPINFFRALLDSLNPCDFLMGIAHGIGLIFGNSMAPTSQVYSGNYYGAAPTGQHRFAPMQETRYASSGPNAAYHTKPAYDSDESHNPRY